MRVRDLGPPVIAVDAVDHPVTGTRVPAILALLAIHINHRVSTDALMDAAWGDQHPHGTASTLLSHIWRLRRLLEPTRGSRQTPRVLISDQGGYRLLGSAQTVDALAFVQLADQARDLLAAGRAGAAVARTDEALALWRGRPYGVFADREWAASAVARLEEVHEQVLERRVESLLAAGEPDRALADVEALVAATPFRERLWSVRMLALHRTGRAREALATYQQVRELLVEQVGVEPGAELRDLHQRILADDPGLMLGSPVPVVSVASAASGPAIEVHLPSILTDLIGREQDRRALSRLVCGHDLVSVVGPAGSGKTRLAIEVARDLAPDFPDGVWFVDLTAVADPDLVVDVTISSIGFATSPGAAPPEELRNYLRGRQVLLVLDNCEHVLSGVAELVEVVLGGTRPQGLDSALLATSREPLAVAGETIWTLGPLGLPLTSDPHSAGAAPAVELFVQRLRACAPELDLDEQALARVVQICVSLDGLPLALELAAARCRSHTLDDVAAQVSYDPSTLGRLGRGHSDHRATISSLIEWSHRMLPGSEQVAHRRLSVLPGPFTREVAHAVTCSAAVSGADTDNLLAQLVHRSMLTPDGARRPGGPSTFHQLSTVRAHAHHALVDAGEDLATIRRRDDWTASVLDDRPPLGAAAEVAWLHRVDDNYPTIRATLAHRLTERGDPRAARLASRLGFYWYYRGRMLEGGRWLELAYNAIGTSGSSGSSGFGDVLVTRAALGALLAAQGRTDLARPHVSAVLESAASVPEDRLVEVGESVAGLAIASWVRDDAVLVARLHALLGAIADRCGDPGLALVADAVGCVATFGDGDRMTATEVSNDVYERGAAAGNLLVKWVASGPPMIAALLAGDPSAGIPWADRILENHLPLGSGACGSFIETRANFAVLVGDLVQAARLYAVAERYTRRAAMVWPRRPMTDELLAGVRDRLGPDEFARAWRDGERLTASDVVRPPETQT